MYFNVRWWLHFEHDEVPTAATGASFSIVKHELWFVKRHAYHGMYEIVLSFCEYICKLMLEGQCVDSAAMSFPATTAVTVFQNHSALFAPDASHRDTVRCNYRPSLSLSDPSM